MTPPKTLTPAEALRALSEGKKLTCIGYESYICLDRGVIVWSGGHTYKGDFNNLTEYTEPKPKRKVAPYYIHPEGCNTFLTADCYETEEEAKKIYAKACSVTRCTALEIEVPYEA